MSEKRDIVVNGYAYPGIKKEVLDDWLPSLTFVSAFSYGFTRDGNLIDLKDENLREEAGSYGTGVLMVLTPLDSTGSFNNQLAKELLEDSTAVDVLIENILEVLKAKDMMGVDFDFEYVFEENRDQYTMLVAKASDRLNEEGFLVTVALAPKTSADQQGLLYRGHDYKGMGLAANFVLIMTYEWGYTYGPPMAVAPYDQVRRVVQYGVSEIDPEKILMGMANYGYDWTLPYVRGSSRAEKLSYDEAVYRAEVYGVQIQFDEKAKSPYYYYKDDEQKEHVVWFEDERSWAAKLELLSEFGLAGISIWNVMSVFPSGREAISDGYDIGKVT